MNKQNKSRTQYNSPKVNILKIDKDFCFKTHHNDIKATADAFQYYEEHLINLEDFLKSDILLAFDTNLLLNLYKISKQEREQFLKFVNKNANKIIIPAQVEFEYLKHRTKYIKESTALLDELVQQEKAIAKEICEGDKLIVNKLTQLKQHKFIVNDIPDVQTSIDTLCQYINSHSFSEEERNDIKMHINAVEEKLIDKIKKLKDSCITETKDIVLESISKVQILPILSLEELSYLKEYYDQLLQSYNNHKERAECLSYSFPGCGDRGKIKDGNEPYGDFIIYHELLRQMSLKHKNIIFLTKDITKSDWIKPDGTPFIHYIIDSFKNTNQMLYIFNAEKFIPLTFESIIEDDDSGSIGKIEDINEIEVEFANDIKDNEEGCNNPLPLKNITKDRFMSELNVALAWASLSGEGYVSLSYFIRSILGKKHFCYETSYKVKEELRMKNIIEIYKENIDGNDVECIRIKNSQQNNS